MRVILIRHGIAQDRDLGLPDGERALTHKGRRLLSEHAPHLVNYLRLDELYLVTSPLTRAVQTAEILSEKGLGDFAVKSYPSTGDFDAMRRDVMDHFGKTVLIVGHSPYLEQWTYAITEQLPEMTKGAALEISITDPESFSGKVQWLLPLKKYDRLMDFDSCRQQKARFSDDVEALIRKYIRVILEYRALYLKEPGEIESVHKLRVKIRQFRSLVSFFKPLMKKTTQKKLQSILRAMAQECAYLREIDVIAKEWQKLREEFKKAGLSGDEFLEVLNLERQLEQDRLYGYLEKPEFAGTLNQVETQLCHAIDPDKTQYIDLEQMVEATIKKWHDEIRDGYDAICENDLEVIHALRIRAKKVRYIMEIFELDEADQTREMYREIKRWQEVLGDITDASRNTAAVHEIAMKYTDRPIDLEIAGFDELQRIRSVRLYEDFFGKDPKEHPLPNSESSC